jgi:hypothetical protein
MVNKISRTGLAIILSAFVLVACQFESGIDLGDGYLYVNTNAYNAYIVKDGSIVVDTNVVKAEIRGDYIVGLRTEPERIVDSPVKDISRNYGYFLYDKKTQSLIEGMDIGQLAEALESAGWTPLRMSN